LANSIQEAYDKACGADYFKILFQYIQKNRVFQFLFGFEGEDV
jgi:hypothetical protein